MASKKASQLPVALSVADNDSIILVTGGTTTTKTAPKSVLLNGVATGTDLTSGLATKANASDLTAHIGNTSNPHNVTKTQVGLSNVPNSDTTNRSSHTGTQTASTISDFQTTVSANPDVAASITYAARTDNPHGVTKTQIGLSAVDNTSDGNKPVSTAQQAVLDKKQSRVSITVGPSNSGATYETDGIADDVQIQAAIDAVNVSGGGVVKFLPGTFNLASEVTLKSNVTLSGSGIGVTIILSYVSTSSWAFDTNTTGQAKTDRKNIWITDLTIGSLTASHSVIIRNTTNAGFARVEAFHTVWNTAIRETLVLQHCQNAYFYDCFIHDSTGNGVQVNGCDYFHVRGNLIINFYDNVTQSGTYHMDDGVDIDEDFLDSHTIPSRYGLVEDNTVVGSTNGNNFRIASSQHVTVSQNTSIDHDCNAAASILVNSYSGTGHPDTHSIVISGNKIVGGTDAGIKVQSSTSPLYNISVLRNQLRGCGNTAASGQLGAGILLVADGVVVEDNFLDNCGKNSADAGALMLYASKNNQIIRRNRIINSPGSAVRFWNGNGTSTYTGIILEDTDLSSNMSNYANLSVVTFVRATRNMGLNPAGFSSQGNVTGATTFTRVNGDTIVATLTGNVTVSLSAGAIAGDQLAFILTQDATGSRTVTWPSNFKKTGGSLMLSTAANAVDVISMRWDGSFWREVSRSMGSS